MGKKHRNRINEPKKNNHVSESAIETEHTNYEKEDNAQKRKSGPGNHLRDY
ncbi:hypothetical protein LC087_03865 [Bacillus carboniphilus]|uniref:Uncharacterized protein n=1 Tax=Bacillus carboniphilus TaxID=86663 RepID=A0ABY9JXU0_9BACI|nr:hypothetical protein [Bacillus carboniphilus]WLR43333.1 hypothetical protein LC087_03865 [Bacillus carboniphilus]